MHAEKNLKKETQLISRKATHLDDLSIRKIISVPLTTRGILLSFQREPSYFKASSTIYTVNDHIVIEDQETQKIVACFSNGSRPCYVNQQIKMMRYSCDLRVDPAYRGNVLKHIAKQMHETMVEPDFSQCIIFNDNYIARAAIQTGKFGMPNYYSEGDIETLTLTGFKSNKKIQAFLSQYCQMSPISKIHSCTAKAEHIPLMNAFIQKMSQYYNYIPAYNFSEIQQDSLYFQGLALKDFQLYFMENELVGMFGLWDQHSFKQSKIVDYGKLIGLARPFYNAYSRFIAGLYLPKKGQSLKYYVLHSLLCHPEFLTLHHQMLKDAFESSVKRGCRNISFTLSHRDPRFKLNQFYKGEVLIGNHAFLSFADNLGQNMDPKLIPYFEVGRI